MRTKTISIIAIACLLVSASNKANSTEKDFALQIYLLREISIENDAPNLGQVSIIRGDESLVAKASEIALGRISVPGQKIIVDRTMVLSRLACNGIPASKVILTGAEKATVKQQRQIIKSNELVEMALSFIKQNPPAASICQFNPTRIPKDFIIPGEVKDIKLVPRLARSRIRNQVKIHIAVLSGGKEIGVREVTFRLKYNCRKVVAQVDIPQGAVISPANVTIEKTLSNYPEPANWTPPYGLIAKRRLPAKTNISANMVAPVKPKVLLKRNQNVVMIIDRLGLLITAIGKTLQDGRVGEYIKVRNADSQRIIMAKVNEDGTVEPVF